MKKTFNVLTTIAAVALLFTATACTDFLTIYPTDKVVLEDFWQDKADVENMVANSYRNMVTSDFINRQVVWGELRSDDVIETTNTGTNEKYINNANLLPTNDWCDWSSYYRVINNCNIVLKFAPQVMEKDPDFTAGDLAVVRGEMLAIRAYCHFWLVRTFRDIPLLLEAKVDDSQNLYILQSEPLVTLDSILVDLDEAEDLVLASGAYANLNYNKGRFTADAVRALRADVLLWKAAFQQNKSGSDGSDCYDIYTQCIEDCERIMADRIAYMEEYNYKHNIEDEQAKNATGPVVGYPLELNQLTQALQSCHDEPYRAIFGGSMNNLKESIFELQCDMRDNRNYTIPRFYGYGSGSRIFNASTWIGKEDEDNGLFKKTDLRRATSAMQNSDEEDVFPISKYVSTSTSNGATDKNRIPVIRQFNTEGSSRYMECNWIVYRLTDVMLMEAEALALRADSAKNDLKNAFRLVKAVYYRSNPYKVPRNDSISYTAGNAASMHALVLDERQRELCFESKRWFDLVRMALRDGDTKNMLDIMVPHKYESNQSAIRSKMASLDALFFPIYEREIKTDSMLVQNPNYIIEDVYSKN